MTARSVALLGLLACHTPPAVTPRVRATRMAGLPFLVVGRVIAQTPDVTGDGPGIVIVDADGRPYRAVVLQQAPVGVPLTLQGQRVRAWCRAAGADTVADSVRVDGEPDVSAEPFMLAGQVRAIWSVAGNRAPLVLVVDHAGRAAHVLVLRLQFPDMRMQVGDTLVVWAHAEGADTLADSAVVD